MVADAVFFPVIIAQIDLAHARARVRAYFDQWRVCLSRNIAQKSTQHALDFACIAAHAHISAEAVTIACETSKVSSSESEPATPRVFVSVWSGTTLHLVLRRYALRSAFSMWRTLAAPSTHSKPACACCCHATVVMESVSAVTPAKRVPRPRKQCPRPGHSLTLKDIVPLPLPDRNQRAQHSTGLKLNAATSKAATRYAAYVSR